MSNQYRQVGQISIDNSRNAIYGLQVCGKLPAKRPLTNGLQQNQFENGLLGDP